MTMMVVIVVSLVMMTVAVGGFGSGGDRNCNSVHVKGV